MKIIKEQPNASGAYSAPQNWEKSAPPESYAFIADTVDLTDFYAYNGFVTPIIEGDTVTEYTPNVEAWEAWKAEQPEPAPPEPTMEERMSSVEDQLTQTDESLIGLFESQALLEEQLAQADETAIYLFEMQATQDEINAAQDEALIALFEMMGGEE